MNVECWLIRRQSQNIFPSFHSILSFTNTVDAIPLKHKISARSCPVKPRLIARQHRPADARNHGLTHLEKKNVVAIDVGPNRAAFGGVAHHDIIDSPRRHKSELAKQVRNLQKKTTTDTPYCAHQVLDICCLLRRLKLVRTLARYA